MLSDGRYTVKSPRTQRAFIASYKEPWTASAFEHFYRFSLDLASTGASAAIAKTAIAPMERAKASPWTSSRSEGCSYLWLASCRITCNNHGKAVNWVCCADPDASLPHEQPAKCGKLQQRMGRPEKNTSARGVDGEHRGRLTHHAQSDSSGFSIQDQALSICVYDATSPAVWIKEQENRVFAGALQRQWGKRAQAGA